jgi:hypothetical protein
MRKKNKEEDKEEEEEEAKDRKKEVSCVQYLGYHQRADTFLSLCWIMSSLFEVHTISFRRH